MFPDGQYVRGYLATNDLTTAAAIPLFDANGASVTLQKGQRLLVDELLIANGATASIITVFGDTNGNGTLDAGEELVSVSLGVNLQTALPSASGTIANRQIGATAAINKLLAVASAASVGTRIVLVGRIVNT